MAHPHHKDHVKNEARRVKRLDLPDAGALSGEGRLQKLNLHEDEGGNPPAPPTGMADAEPAPPPAPDEADGMPE